MRPYPVQMEPPCKRVLPYYTKPVEPIEKYSHTRWKWNHPIEPKCT